MKNTLLVLLLSTFALAPAHAEEASMVADLATGPDVQRSSGDGPMIVVRQPSLSRQLLFFAADDGRHGNELWATEIGPGGNLGTTRLVADLCPGPCSGNPTGLTAVGEELFFFAEEGLYRRALFTSRGLSADTARVKALVEFDPYWPYDTARGAAFDGEFFFVAPQGGCLTVWASDGTPAGTRAVEPCVAPGPVRDLRVTSSGVYFSDYTRGLRKAEPDATEEDGYRVLGLGVFLSESTVVGDALLGARYTPPTLYRASGGGVDVVKEFAENAAVSLLNRFDDGEAAAKAVFRVTTYPTEGAPQVVYHESDGTPEGTIPSPALAFATGMLFLNHAEGNRVLLFWDTQHEQLYGATWSANEMVKDDVENLAYPFVDRGLGRGTAFELDNELWHVDTDLDLRRVAPHYGAPLGEANTLDTGDTFYRLDIADGSELYLSADGYGTPVLVADIARTAVKLSDPRPTATADGFLALLSDGRLAAVDAAATSATVVDVGPFDWLAATAGKLFLRGRDEVRMLAVSQGGAATDLGVEKVASSDTNRPAALGGSLYFTTDNPGQDVRFSDGTPGGTYLLYDVDPDWFPACNIVCPPEALISYPTVIAADAQRVFWDRAADDGVNGLLSARTGQPGFEQIAQNADAPFLGLVWQGTAYFVAGYEVPEIWASDGTDEGTRLLTTLEGPRSLNQPTKFVQHRGLIFFVAQRADRQELWRTDGTPAGTALFHDFGAATTFGELAVVGNRLFLAVATDTLGAELWTIGDGAPALVRDIFPGSRSSFPNAFFAMADGKLVFAADDGATGAEPWISDGTTAGTRRLADIAPGASGPHHFAERQGRLVFAADDGVHGRELWTMVPQDDEEPEPTPPCPAGRLCLLDDRFEVRVEFRSPTGVEGEGQRVLASQESGVFSFFSPENWELQVKVLDGCAINQRFWVFGAATTNVEYTVHVTDRATGAVRTYHNPQGTLSPAITDTAAFATCGATPPEPRYAPDPTPPAAPICPDDPTAFCIEGYRLSLRWETPAGLKGDALPVPYGSRESGLFTFFSPDNWEMMVKLLDGCWINGHFWLFAAGSTDVGWTLTVERPGHPGTPTQVYTKEPGVVAPTLAVTSALPCQ